MKRLTDTINQLERASKELKRNLSVFNTTEFTYEEQELIRRVFKAVEKQFKSQNDLLNAKAIINKTDWLDQ